VSEEKIHEKWEQNTMLKPRIEKVTINMCVGSSGQPLEKAVNVLERLTGQKPSKRNARKTIRDFGITKGEPIACLVTLRGDKAKRFLVRVFQAVDNKLSKDNFDVLGNFSFGIKEHIEIPGTKYLPELGIHGMDVCVALGKPGRNVMRKHRARSKVGTNHLLTPREGMLFIKEEFGVEIK
jgi:large subunit ribosomal protein L5